MMRAEGKRKAPMARFIIASAFYFSGKEDVWKGKILQECQQIFGLHITT